LPHGSVPVATGIGTDDGFGHHNTLAEKMVEA
jgi:hypothetical protein